jgi:hypothetical protein
MPATFRMIGKVDGRAAPRPALAPIVGFKAKPDERWLSIRQAPKSAKTSKIHQINLCLS